MQYTPNFNFMIAEGTDTVNLLTQCYPNFTSLDTILQAIKEAGVTEAVTTKVGTVHNIVRNVADCNVIRWVNTANYAAGDTFTVDGTPVTATTMDGQSLPAGAFVINQSCLAILNGTVLTFVGGTGSSTVAAEDVTYDNSGSGLAATDVQDAIDEVLGDIPANAAALSYDNTGSGLAATNVQDAIDEVVAGGSYTGFTLAKSIPGSSITNNAQINVSEIHNANEVLIVLKSSAGSTFTFVPMSVLELMNGTGVLNPEKRLMLSVYQISSTYISVLFAYDKLTDILRIDATSAGIWTIAGIDLYIR